MQPYLFIDTHKLTTWNNIKLHQRTKSLTKQTNNIKFHYHIKLLTIQTNNILKCPQHAQPKLIKSRTINFQNITNTFFLKLHTPF